MDNPLACTWDEFRVIARDFLKAAPTAPDLESLDNGQKCVGLAYLNCTFPDTPLGEHYRTVTAVVLMGMITKAYILREIELS
jgi:hypothetical protein